MIGWVPACLLSKLLTPIRGARKRTPYSRSWCETVDPTVEESNLPHVAEPCDALGEVYEGKHTPIISKRLFDDVQNALERRGKPQKAVKELWPFCGLIHCSCGMMFTNERQVKRQKNGNVYVYDYYRCTRKNKAVACKEPHIRAEELDKQLSNLLLDFAMPTKWADKLYELIRQDEQKDKISFNASISKAQEQIVQLSSKLQRLLDGYLDGDVERELYQVKRAEILGEKKRLQEQIEQSSLGVLTWVEPMKRWLETAVSICKIAKSHDQIAKKSLCLEIFGSNLKIQNKNVVAGDDQFLHSPQENIWLWLRQNLEKAARSGDQISESSIVVRARGLEPPRAQCSLAPQASASTNSATPAYPLR